MAPSIEQVVPESVQQTAEHVQEKLGAISLGNSPAGVEEQKPVEKVEEAAPAVQAPAAPVAEVAAEESVKPAAVPASNLIKAPLKLSGAIESWKNFEVTPVIGREYADVDLAAVLKAENSNELLRDLAITISQRGVVFFRAQDNLTDDLQKELAQRLGELSGKPETSKLHIHPVANAGREHGGSDNEISVISSAQAKSVYLHSKSKFISQGPKKQNGKIGWHSDITFEPIPSDYSILRLVELPSTGGDTLWASGYELYDRISEPYQRFLETLTATYAQPGFNEAAAANGFKLYTEARGAPENVGELLEAIHPVIRTNPVTGWKSVFAVGQHVGKINDVTELESEALLAWFVRLLVDNHDLQVRHKWQNKNDLAIWDNRSVYHAATPDYVDGNYGERKGNRAVSLGERPYLDPASVSRREALAAESEASA
ncbi:hypothetical protein VE03_04807 [Pseudogymnoascus sp. 23342-1-I1]|nr:hypothetical protein VE03_04807 [Pseudogymnoascus sp. 23342-1-I1]